MKASSDTRDADAESHLPGSLAQWHSLLNNLIGSYEGQLALGDDPSLFADVLSKRAASGSNATEQSIRSWIATGSSLLMTEEQSDCLLFRLVLAKRIVAGLAGANSAGVIREVGSPPDLPHHRRAFAEWLLIKCWTHLGDLWLHYWAADVVKKHFPE